MRPGGESQGTWSLAFGDSVSPSGGWGRERAALPDWVLLGPRGFGSPRGSSTRARGDGSWLRESGARDHRPSRTPGTPGQRDALVPPLRPQSPPPHSGGVGFGPPSPGTSPTGQGSRGDRGVVLGGAAGGVWQEAWPCCLVTREVGHCCSEICVRLGHQATTPRARQPRSLALSLDA